MPYTLCLAGLSLSLLSAVGLLVLPVEAALRWRFWGLVLGLGLAALGGYLRFREHAGQVRAAMVRFATQRGLPYRQTLSSETLPGSITLFRRGKNRRCENAIGVRVDSRRACSSTSATGSLAAAVSRGTGRKP